MGSLRTLRANVDLLLNSAAELRTATQLQHLCFHGMPQQQPGQHSAWQAFWRWAEETGSSPSLRRLTFDNSKACPIPVPVFHRVLGVLRARPELEVFCTGCDGNAAFAQVRLC